MFISVYTLWYSRADSCKAITCRVWLNSPMESSSPCAFVIHRYILVMSATVYMYSYWLLCLFDLILYVPDNNISVMSGQVFMGLTSKASCSKTQRSASGEARTATPRSRVKHSTCTTDPPRSYYWLRHTHAMN